MAQIKIQEILEPPRYPGNIKDFTTINNYLTKLYNFNYIVWNRVGKYAPDDNSYKNMVFQNSNNIAITGGIIENVTIQSSSLEGVFIDLSTINDGVIEDSTITTSSISDSNLTECPINMGGSGNFIKLGGNAYTNTTSIGNVGSSLTNMLEYTQPADSMNTDGSYVEIEGWGRFAANGNNKKIVLYFGSTVLLDTGLLAANSGSWVVNATVIRVSASSQKAIVKIASSNSLIVASTRIATPAENTANPINIKFASQGVANDDVIQDCLTVKFFNK